MRTLAGGAQQPVHLSGGQAKRPALAHNTHRLDVQSDVACHGAIGLGPAQQVTYRFQTPIDRGRLQPTLRYHMLAPSDQIVLGELAEFRHHVVQAGVPSDELQEVIPIAAAGCGRQIVGRQPVKECLQPRGEGFHPAPCLYCTPCRPPG